MSEYDWINNHEEISFFFPKVQLKLAQNEILN